MLIASSDKDYLDAYKHGYTEGRENAASDFALAAIKAYLDDSLDECEIHRIERAVKEQNHA